MTQMSASRTSRIGFPVRFRMPMKIDTCCVIRSVANVTPKMSPRNLLRSPVSILSAIQLIRCPLSSREGLAFPRCGKQGRGQTGETCDSISQVHQSQGLATRVRREMYPGEEENARTECQRAGTPPTGGH